MTTYRAFQAMRGLGSDCYNFRGLQARELCGDFALNHALRWISDSKIPSFQAFSQTLSGCFLQFQVMFFDVYNLCVYKGMASRMVLSAGWDQTS